MGSISVPSPNGVTATNGESKHLPAAAKLSSQRNGDTKTATIPSQLRNLYADDAVLKIWKTATEHLARKAMPQSGPECGQYQYRDAEFWTCGFFPGSLYCLLERSIKYPQHFLCGASHDGGSAGSRQRLRDGLLQVCRDWAQPLHQMAYRTDTHDIGFIVEPALRRDYELTGNAQSLQSIMTAAESLASRYSEATSAIRSWDTFVNNRHGFSRKEDCFLVIIDSMCNLDLLYYAGHHASSQRLIDIATTHAHTVRQTHLRQVPSEGSAYAQYSTCHVANVCPETGKVVQRLTAQGYADDSTWARGQAWAILGYAQTYNWTKDPVFLSTACGLAEHFIARMESAPSSVEVVQADGTKTGRYVPLWDFDAPIDESDPLRDSSAGMIAANGLLLIHCSLNATGDAAGAQRFFDYAIKIVKETLELCYGTDELRLVVRDGDGEGGGRGTVAAEFVGNGDAAQPFDAILKRATANFNRDWTDKYANHGLVYGDYYLLEFGNRLLHAGIC
ncbi:glucuronyl hydrolase [Purpureocillium lavendulum]|uniref:Glucuronyl hydrolase n=1 Tax=Purpureocillium lavendulum TaxID=1247861 RepID=A0AB34G6T6_9HYPO|nr:glucuronyl hydrolase [Purpureocillium lavendulum]